MPNLVQFTAVLKYLNSLGYKPFLNTPPPPEYSLNSKPFKISVLALIFSTFLVAIGVHAVDSNSVLMNMNKFRQCINAIDTQVIGSNATLMNKLNQCVNTIGVRATNTFNKAAYLDFSKPYTDNWNNPQNYLKKTTKQPPY